MKAMFTLLFISFTFVYAQESETKVEARYAQDLAQNSIESAQKLDQSKAIITHVSNLMLEGSVQRQNVKLAISYYFDFSKPCIPAGNPNKKEITPVDLTYKGSLLCDQ
jgi:hypothetical protein